MGESAVNGFYAVSSKDWPTFDSVTIYSFEEIAFIRIFLVFILRAGPMVYPLFVLVPPKLWALGIANRPPTLLLLCFYKLATVWFG